MDQSPPTHLSIGSRGGLVGVKIHPLRIVSWGEGSGLPPLSFSTPPKDSPQEGGGLGLVGSRLGPPPGESPRGGDGMVQPPLLSAPPDPRPPGLHTEHPAAGVRPLPHHPHGDVAGGGPAWVGDESLAIPVGDPLWPLFSDMTPPKFDRHPQHTTLPPFPPSF